MTETGCKNLVFTCVDYRLQNNALIKPLQKIGLVKDGKNYLITRVGGPKIFSPSYGYATMKADLQRLSFEIEIAVRRGYVDNIIFVSHTDCLAYGHPARWSLRKKIIELCSDLRHAANFVVQHQVRWLLDGESRRLSVFTLVAIMRGEKLVELRRVD